MPSSKAARVFIAIVVLSGFAVLGNALLHARSDNRMRFISFVVVACLAAKLKVKLPGMTGTMSVNLPFILVAVAEMNAAEALLVAGLSTLVQCLPSGQKKFNWIQALFNVATIMLAADATRLIYSSATLVSATLSRSLLLAVAAAGYFFANSIVISIIIGLTEKQNVLRAWGNILQLSYPYYLASAGVAGVVLTASAHVGWQVPVVLFPVMAGMFFSYRRYFAATLLAEDQKRSPQVAAMAHAVS